MEAFKLVFYSIVELLILLAKMSRSFSWGVIILSEIISQYKTARKQGKERQECDGEQHGGGHADPA